MPSIDGLEDEGNAWDDEVQVNRTPNKPLPESLRAGPAGALPNASQDTSRPYAITNPFLQKQGQAADSNRDESSANAWGAPSGHPPQPSQAPPPPPSNGMPAGLDSFKLHDLT
jgi:hypothetical protein